MNTSAQRIMRSNSGLASALVRSNGSDRLLRATMAHINERPARCTPIFRSGSPPRGSNCTTSAPKSASRAETCGADINVDPSNTRTPASAPPGAGSVVIHRPAQTFVVDDHADTRRFGDDLFAMHGAGGCDHAPRQTLLHPRRELQLLTDGDGRQIADGQLAGIRGHAVHSGEKAHHVVE